MATSDYEGPRFVKVALPQTWMTGELILPKKFAKYADGIPPKIQIILRNGHQWEVRYSKETNSISGLKSFLNSFHCTGGAFLFMKYSGGGNFMCDAFPLVAGSQTWSVECDLFGRKIFKIIVDEGHHFNDMVIPTRVLAELQKDIPNNIMMKLKNGKQYVGNYETKQKMLSGFKQLEDSIELQTGDIVLLSPEVDETYLVSVFGPDGMEKNPKRYEQEGGDSVKKFEICVKPSHLQKYSQGVMVPVKYKNITEGWEAIDFIEVTDGIRRWRIQIKKRDNRTELHRGWEIMWKDLKRKR